MPKIFRAITRSEKETKKLARAFASEILRFKSSRALVVGLWGGLGAGKTVFAKGFAGGLGIKEEMKSPSFVLMRAFFIPKTKKRFFHIDAWRGQLDFREFLKNPNHILLVEWAQNARKFLPKNYFKLKFKILSKNARELTLWR